MFGLSIADIAVLVFYFLGITYIGIRAARRVQNTDDYIMPRRFGKLMMMMHSFGTSTHSDQAVGLTSKTSVSGLSGIWYQWMWLFATPFFWFIAPMMRRFRALTTADVFALRYDRGVAALYSVLGLGKFMMTIGLMLAGSSVVVDAVTGGTMPAHWVIIAMTVLFVTYGMAGGLGAAIITDFIQGILTLLFSFMLLPLILSAVGGVEGMKTSLIEMRPDTAMLSLVTPGDIGVFFIAVIALNNLLGVVVQPHNMGACAAGRTEMEGAIGFMGGTMVKRVCTVAWSITALAAVAYYGGSIPEPDLVYGQMAREFLPQVFPGLLGLFLAALLASVMGSCDSFMISSAGLVTENLYKPFFPNRSDKHYLNIARLAGLLCVLGGVVIALLSDSVVRLLEHLWKINSMTAMAFWLGLFWRRTSVIGAWAAIIAPVLTWWLTSQTWFNNLLASIPGFQDWGIVRGTDGDWSLWLPWQMLAYIGAGFLAGIVVSLFSSPVSSEKLERYYGLLRTPIVPNEEVPEACHLPEGVTPGPRRVFFPKSNFEIPIPTRSAMLGFLAGWICVLMIIGVVVVWIAD
ncbi:MAG: sodium:solute symporter family protein [Opitutales bacterium]|nr:sodium:solute symporter family protein [Opitutales bacterium]MDG2168844.1 sodium:solute symporter family protein [Opitutales bacterium]